jgi:hypothetical protein
VTGAASTNPTNPTPPPSTFPPGHIDPLPPGHEETDEKKPTAHDTTEDDFRYMRDVIQHLYSEQLVRDGRFNHIGTPPWLNRPEPATPPE